MIRTSLLAVFVAALAWSGAATAGTSPLTNPKHFFWAHDATVQGTANSAANDLIWHGGNAGSGAIGVETKPAVYLVYWGAEWAAGFQTADTNGTLYSSRTLQSYVNSFFANVGGSPWAGVQTQYCQGIMAPAFSCTGQAGAQFITNPTSQLKGTWTDPTAVPANIVASGLASNLTTDPIEAEAIKASQHFGYD